jgi:hypothetical protein
MRSMAASHEELAKEGILDDLAELRPGSGGSHITLHGSKRRVSDGQSTEWKQQIASFTIGQMGHNFICGECRDAPSRLEASLN